MANTKLSQSPFLSIIATAFGTISLGFGINSILNPMSELSFFELQGLAATADPILIECLMIAFGAKLIGAALAVFATAFFGSRKALGCVLIAGGGVAGVDGWICKSYMGTGEWNHWGYGSMMVILGTVLMGILDGK
ncbi:uncharacterized protein LY89DRAFT_191880 [Mollisia scopiformis]|uniref:Uncharacterized protein n=1 Tax=Mollisia scopiformis TaxID=149040 RepID=A0A194WXU2_MOLSC|nr:uncharacterized protein LY89DRAFT_191880 [Mollisia scopiformis]KUJ12750.1 hypothetical protein LY89DRAFT_191880 [Mollisia scopiformis]